MAEILLAEDKGWDAAKVDDLVEHGPEDNAIEIEHPIGVHVTYFTAWVDDNGETQMASDIYGHEKRITQALAGQWNQIARARTIWRRCSSRPSRMAGPSSEGGGNGKNTPDRGRLRAVDPRRRLRAPRPPGFRDLR